MDYVMHAEGGKFGLVGQDLGPAVVPASLEERIQACELEIAKVLEKYGCILIVSVAAKP